MVEDNFVSSKHKLLIIDYRFFILSSCLLFSDRGGDIRNVETAYMNMDVDHNGTISFGEFLLWLNWVNFDDFLLPIEDESFPPVRLTCMVEASQMEGVSSTTVDNGYNSFNSNALDNYLRKNSFSNRTTSIK